VIEFFISYRAVDEPHAAALVAHTLSNRVGQGRVFLDTASIPTGAHFPSSIWQALSSCRALVAIIGNRWLEPVAGARRIDDPTDFVRREIATALTRGIDVVPVLVAGAAPPDAHDLPADIAGLSERQVFRLRDRDQLEDAERLAGFLALDAPPPGQGRVTTVTNTFHAPVTAGTIGVHLAVNPADDR
jgi:hypothetical protein